MARWPLPRRISPFYDEVSPKSAEWFRSFHAFAPDKQTFFDQCNAGLLAALCYPDADKEHVRGACNLINLLFAFDDLTDELCESDAQKLADITIEALQNPTQPRPAEEPVFGEVIRQFWIDALGQHATNTCQARFASAWRSFVLSVVEQAKDRDEGRVRNMKEHMQLRRYTIGMEPCYAFAELRLNLPEELVNHPLLQSLRSDVNDMLIYDNDMVSYSKEHAAGDDAHNVITIAMREYGLDLNGALDWLAEQIRARADRALALGSKALALSASYPKVVDEEFAVYIDHIMNWFKGCHCWNYEGGRYFGQVGLKVQESRVVELLPKRQK